MKLPFASTSLRLLEWVASVGALVALVAACSGGDASSSPAPSNGAGDDDSGASAANDGGSASDAGASLGDDATTSTGDGGTHADSGSANALAPHPPAGATQCGHGSFGAADVVAACNAPSFFLDHAPLPDGGSASISRACNALDTAGGSWEAWCTANETYVWARLDHVTNNGTMKDCHNQSILQVEQGVYEESHSAANDGQVGTYLANGTQIIGTAQGAAPQTAIFQKAGLEATTNGGAHLFFLGSPYLVACPGPGYTPTVFFGVDVTWKR